MALTLDGFLPHEDEMLMRWVRENKRYGFPRWQRQATFHIYPHYGLMDLLNVKEKHDKDCIYLAGVGDGGSLSNLFIKYQILSNIRLLNTYISSSLI